MLAPGLQAKVLDKLGQCSALVIITGYCSEEGCKPFSVTQACTCGKMTDLQEKKPEHFNYTVFRFLIYLIHTIYFNRSNIQKYIFVIK